MPVAIISWLPEVCRPRVPVGASSARYVGTVLCVLPTASPASARPTRSTPYPDANAITRLDTTYSAQVTSSVPRRPMACATQPATADPTTAPTSSVVTTAPL